MLNEDTINAIMVALEFRERTLAQDPNMKTALHWTRQGLSLARSLKAGDTIASLWSVDDVYSLVEGDGDNEPSVKITVAEARAVLAQAERNHDAEYGINWDSLRSHLYDVLSERGEDPNGGDGIDD